LFLENKLPEL